MRGIVIGLLIELVIAVAVALFYAVRLGILR